MAFSIIYPSMKLCNHRVHLGFLFLNNKAFKLFFPFFVFVFCFLAHQTGDGKGLHMYVAGLFFFRQREIQAGTVDCNKMGRVSGKNYRAHRLFGYNQLTPMIFKLFFEKVKSKRKSHHLEAIC